MTSKFLSSIITLFIISTYCLSQENKTAFFIAENPAQFEILNRYQQKIPVQDKLFFRHFTPWKIIEKQTFLSDQFTGAMEVELDGKTYFFVRDDAGSFVGEGEGGLFYSVTGAEAYSEKLRVIQNKAVLFSRLPFWKKSTQFKRSYLEKGQVLKTVFKKGNDYFVQQQDAKKQYGWIRSSGRLSLKKMGQVQVDENDGPQINPDILAQLEKKIESVNSVYKKLFQKLNAEKNQNKLAPFWSLESNAKGIVLELQNNQSGKFKKSRSYFLEEVEGLFGGKGYEIYSSGPAIEILKK